MHKITKSIVMIACFVVVTSLAYFFFDLETKRDDELRPVTISTAKINVLAIVTGAEPFEVYVERLNETFGPALQKRFPGLEVEYLKPDIADLSANNYVEELEREIIEKNIDVIYISFDPSDRIISKLIENQFLYNLSTLVQDINQFGMSQGTIMKLSHNNDLYALAMTLNTVALVYNPELFDKYQVQVPVDFMTWNDVFTLARQFPIDEVAGFSTYSGEPLPLILRMAMTNEISFVDDELGKATINTPEWRELISLAINGLNNKYIVSDTSNEMFFSGKSAMTLISYETLMNLHNRYNSTIEWLAVTQPINPLSAEATSVYPATDVWAIYEKSEESIASWDYIQFMNSFDSVETWHTMYPAKLLSNIDVMQKFETDRVSAYYKLHPSDYKGSMLNQGRSQRFLEILQTEIGRIQRGEIDINEGLRNMEKLGNELLQAK